ncbi:hypothetical protein, partial [Paraburkholderia solisilvae]|uniref:hypothetical protein n=1 Tax=Paraburkholderia solisilvae TaxID=624376 RepID=UPI001C2EA6DA
MTDALRRPVRLFGRTRVPRDRRQPARGVPCYERTPKTVCHKVSKKPAGFLPRGVGWPPAGRGALGLAPGL